MKKWTEEEIKKLIELYTTVSNTELSKILGRTIKSIARKSEKLGLKKTKGTSHIIIKRTTKKMPSITKEELVELYINQCMAMWKISKKIGVSIGTVFNYLKFYDIPCRSQKDTFTFAGHKHNEVVVENIKKMHKGKHLSDETKGKISKGNKGKRRVINEWNGHKKYRKDGYVSVYVPEHPNANVDGYVLEHRLVMEKHIGRYIKETEVIHHIDENKSNNDINNLMLFTSRGKHLNYHKNLNLERKNEYYEQITFNR